MTPYWKPDVVTSQVFDPSQTKRIRNGKGLIEMQVSCTSKSFDLIFNDRRFYGLMNKATPYKVSRLTQKLGLL